jgi:hypothetical protein
MHAVGFDPHDGARMRGQEDVGDLGEHGVGEVLDHERHAVGPRPAEAEGISQEAQRHGPPEETSL